MVSEWMDNGNINEFLKNNADADRVELVSALSLSLSLLALITNICMITVA